MACKRSAVRFRLAPPTPFLITIASMFLQIPGQYDWSYDVVVCNKAVELTLAAYNAVKLEPANGAGKKTSIRSGRDH